MANMSRGEACHEGRFRQCAVTRRKLPVDDLMRFVATPEGQIVPDIARRLPGRGVWINANYETVARAIAKNTFARSLKRRVDAGQDLPDLVAVMLRKRALDGLALANKAGLVVTGYSKLEAAIARDRVAVLIHASEAAVDGRRKLDQRLLRADKEGLSDRPIVAEFTRMELSLALGRSNVVHAGLIEGGAAVNFLRAEQRLARYMAGTIGEDNGLDEPCNG